MARLRRNKDDDENNINVRALIGLQVIAEEHEIEFVKLAACRRLVEHSLMAEIVRNKRPIEVDLREVLRDRSAGPAPRSFYTGPARYTIDVVPGKPGPRLRWNPIR